MNLGLSLDDSLVRFGDFRTSSGQQGARELLSLTPPPTALVTANNQMTLGALLAIRELGFRIPDDVSVVGFDDAEWAPLVSPPLTTLAQPTYELGVRAMRLLLKRIEDPDGDMERLLLEPELVVRESTAPPAGKGRKG